MMKLLFTLSALTFLTALPVRADLGSSSTVSPANGGGTFAPKQGSAKITKEDAQKLQALVKSVYLAEGDGNKDEVERSTESVRRFLIQLKNKGIALSVNPTQFVSTRDLTKQLDKMASTQVADLSGLKRATHACVVALHLMVGVSDVMSNNCAAADVNISEHDELEDEVMHLPPVAH